MFGFLLGRILARMDMPDSHRAYMTSFYRASPKAIRKMAGLHKLANHREVVPVEARFAAILVGELAEDCGPCVQIAVDQARKAGVPDDQIEAVLQAHQSAMSPDVGLAFRLARTVVTGTADADQLRQEVRDRWGEAGIVDLVVPMQVYRLYSMIKAGLGY